MANTSNNRGIARSWSLLAFVREYGQPRMVEDFSDGKGGTYAALSFSSDRFENDQIRNYTKADGTVAKSNYVTVSFSQNLKPEETTIDAITKGADSLQVVELQRDSEHPEASFKLCHKGEMPTRGIAMHIG